MKATQFEYYRPKSVAEAVKLLADLAPLDGRIIAGGQTLVPMMAFRLARPAHLIDINSIPELCDLKVAEGKLCIGATVRHATLERGKGSGVLDRYLAFVAHHIAHAPIRSRGTFCGSVANSDPASEWCLVTVTLAGEIVAASRNGHRTILADTFFFGPMTNALASDEMIVEVRLPVLSDTTRCGFYEVSRVAGGFAMAAAAVVYDVKDGRVRSPRLGIGGIESTPRRMAAAEALMEGKSPTEIDIRRVAEIAAETVEPMEEDDGFKRHLVRTVTARALKRTLA